MDYITSSIDTHTVYTFFTSCNSAAGSHEIKMHLLQQERQTDNSFMFLEIYCSSIPNTREVSIYFNFSSVTPTMSLYKNNIIICLGSLATFQKLAERLASCIVTTFVLVLDENNQSVNLVWNMLVSYFPRIQVLHITSGVLDIDTNSSRFEIISTLTMDHVTMDGQQLDDIMRKNLRNFCHC